MGSLLLHYRPESCLFTGDSLAFSATAGFRLTMFPRYGHDAALQAQHVGPLVEMNDFVHLLPGHGRSWAFRDEEERRRMFAEMMRAEGHAV